MDPTAFIALVTVCAPLVDGRTASALVAVESGFNPHAIGVVGGVLDRQPRQRTEALATARVLQAKGWNYSVGLAQINVRNFARLGLTLESAFEPCSNLAAMQTVLADCLDRANRTEKPAQRALRQALSCYYSGNFVTGFDHGYVRRVVKAVHASADRPAPTLARQSKESP
jgi:type IV secretion system protein VirB1